MTAKSETSNVATAVTILQVRKGEEGAFAVWLTEFNKIVSTFAGYVSAVVIPPVPPLQSAWVMVQRFQTIEQQPAQRRRRWDGCWYLGRTASLTGGYARRPAGPHRRRPPALR